MISWFINCLFLINVRSAPSPAGQLLQSSNVPVSEIFAVINLNSPSGSKTFLANNTPQYHIMQQFPACSIEVFPTFHQGLSCLIIHMKSGPYICSGQMFQLAIASQLTDELQHAQHGHNDPRRCRLNDNQTDCLLLKLSKPIAEATKLAFHTVVAVLARTTISRASRRRSTTAIRSQTSSLQSSYRPPSVSNTDQTSRTPCGTRSQAGQGHEYLPRGNG